MKVEAHTRVFKGTAESVVVPPAIPSISDVKSFLDTPTPETPGPLLDKRTKIYRDSVRDGGEFFTNIGNLEVTREPLAIDNPVQWLLLLKPELKPYRWQFEELMRSAGYLEVNGGNLGVKTPIDDQHPYKLVLPAANGSGKDEILIATFSTWFAVTGVRNRVIITSSSFEQTKFQTEVHIRDLCTRANKKFGKLFSFVAFHYVVPELGSEIKLFATDEAGRAEGYHPYHGGKMALILNEAKTIKEDLFDAIDRCTGYSHLFYISSPGRRKGKMYKSAGLAIHYPATPILGQFFCRKVTAFECPHIPKAHIDAMIYEKGENSPWVKSSIFAEFSDFAEPVVIPEYSWNKCLENPPKETGSDIGIGLDLAGGGDENSIWVRKGNKPIFDFHFTMSDTEVAADVIDKQLSPWKSSEYIFRADNGGIGQAIIDKLRTKGWRVRRTNNQSPAYSKSEFLNLGAELYFGVKRLIERIDIILPANNPTLKEQLTTRRYKGEESSQGKLALQSKAEAKSEGLHSPDRADGFVLCFSSYRVARAEDKPKAPVKSYSIRELLELERKGLLVLGGSAKPEMKGKYSILQKV